MYNEPIKSVFMEKYKQSAQTQKLLSFIFNGIEATEEKYGVDFYAMNVEQAQEAFNSVSGIKTNGASSILMILKSYVKWCIANGYPATQAVQELRFDVYDKLRESYVASPEHLQRTLNEVFPNPEKNQIEYIYRTYLWLGFIGLQSSEAIQVTADYIDTKTYMLSFPNPKEPEKRKLYRIYPEAMPDLQQAIALPNFKEPHVGKDIVRERAPGKEILRGKVSKRTLEEAIESTFRPTICRAFKTAYDRYEKQGIKVPAQYSLKLSFRHAYMSGIFYRAYERERAGIPPSFDEIVLEERRNAKEPNFSRNYTERKLLNILIRNMENDYINWKSVFT